MINNASDQLSLIEKEQGENVNVLYCFCSYRSKRTITFSKMAGGWANSPGGWAAPNHALPWLRH